MHKINKKVWLGHKIIIISAVTALILFSAGGILAGATDVSPTKPDRKTISSTDMEKMDVVSVRLPVVAEEEDSPFDFILDPCGLVYETDAIRYGGGKVEKGAALLFHNKEGKYDFSKNSDRLTVENQGDSPVVVTISASVRGLKDIHMAEDNDLSDSGKPEIYLALVDDQGNEQPISADGETSVSCELNSGVYSFGLTGACSSNAEWDDMSPHLTVTVTWHVELISEGDGEEADKEMEGKEDDAESPQVGNTIKHDAVSGKPEDVSSVGAK